MDGSSFDQLSRLAAVEASRRGALGSLLASALGGIGAAPLLGFEAAVARKRKKKKRGCRVWILSGGSDPATEIEVDDDLTVRRNGKIVFEDDDGGSSDVGPIFFTARRGDRLKIVAIDAQADCHELSPLFLHCANGGPPRKLSDGVPESCPNVAVGKFFEKTFTI